MGLIFFNIDFQQIKMGNLKDYCQTIPLWAQFANDSHFIWDTKIKTFDNQFNNKSTICESQIWRHTETFSH